MIGSLIRNAKLRILLASLALAIAVVFLLHEALTHDITTPAVFEDTSEPQTDMTNVKFPLGSPSTWQLARMKYNKLDTTKVAVLIELRRDAQIVPHLMHMMRMLDSDWPFRIYHSKENADFFQARLFREHILSGKLTLVQMNVDLSHKEVSNFLAHRALWDNLAPAKHVLLFQTDSIICSRSEARVEDFFEYDFVGAPVHERFHGDLEDRFMNGGFSLRNREMVLKVIESFLPFSDPDNDIFHHEDQFFARRMRELGANLPPREIAMQFSVESVYYPTPLGIHQATRYLDSPEEAAHIYSLMNEWCPEMHLLYVPQGPGAFVCDRGSEYYNDAACNERKEHAAAPDAGESAESAVPNEAVPVSDTETADTGVVEDPSQQQSIDALVPSDTPAGRNESSSESIVEIAAHVNAIDDAPFTGDAP